MTEDNYNEIKALREALERVTSERDRALDALKSEAITQVNDELDKGEDCPDAWTLTIGGFIVEVECNSEHRTPISAKILADSQT